MDPFKALCLSVLLIGVSSTCKYATNRSLFILCAAWRGALCFRRLGEQSLFYSARAEKIHWKYAVRRNSFVHSVHTVQYNVRLLYSDDAYGRCRSRHFQRFVCSTVAFGVVEHTSKWHVKPYVSDHFCCKRSKIKWPFITDQVIAEDEKFGQCDTASSRLTFVLPIRIHSSASKRCCTFSKPLNSDMKEKILIPNSDEKYEHRFCPQIPCFASVVSVT